MKTEIYRVQSDLILEEKSPALTEAKFNCALRKIVTTGWEQAPLDNPLGRQALLRPRVGPPLQAYTSPLQDYDIRSHALGDDGTIVGAVIRDRLPFSIAIRSDSRLLDLHSRLKREISVGASEALAISPGGEYLVGNFSTLDGHFGIFRFSTSKNSIQVAVLEDDHTAKPVAVDSDGLVLLNRVCINSKLRSFLEAIGGEFIFDRFGSHLEGATWDGETITKLDIQNRYEGSTINCLSPSGNFAAGTVYIDGKWFPARWKLIQNGGLEICELPDDFEEVHVNPTVDFRPLGISKAELKRRYKDFEWINANPIAISDSGLIFGTIDNIPSNYLGEYEPPRYPQTDEFVTWNENGECARVVSWDQRYIRNAIGITKENGLLVETVSRQYSGTRATELVPFDSI